MKAFRVLIMATGTEFIGIETPNTNSNLIWYFNPFKALLVVRDFYKKPVVSRRDTQIVLIQFAHYSGILPIYYDVTTGRFMIYRSFGGLFCWILSLILMIAFTSGLILAQTKSFLFRGFVITNIFDIVPLLFTTMLVCTSFIHMHTVVKRLEIVQLINGYNQHVQYLKRKNFVT